MTTEGSNRVRISYTYNLYAGAFDHTRPAGSQWWLSHKRMEGILKPSNKAYIVDGLYRNATTIWYAGEAAHFSTTNLMNRHPSNSNNMLYFDGHVAGKPGDEILAVVNSATDSMWRLP